MNEDPGEVVGDRPRQQADHHRDLGKRAGPLMSDTTAVETAVALASRVGTPVADAEIDGVMVRQAVRFGDDQDLVELLLDSRGIAPLIRSRRADARDVFPDVDEEEGAARLAAENLIATIAAGPASRAGVDRHGRIWGATRE